MPALRSCVSNRIPPPARKGKGRGWRLWRLLSRHCVRLRFASYYVMPFACVLYSTPLFAPVVGVCFDVLNNLRNYNITVKE